MRRTYRSKKDSGHALDHRDVIQNLDEKDSVFNAFYIQKIKQTKKELSCIGSTNHYGAATSKVRKRKYVKRIVKEVEPSSGSLRESISQSAFLTPDKSIRVNKAQDLFDQLFNSSSPRQINSPVNSRQCFGKFLSSVEGKTYNRKKLSNVKKFNCSSSESYDSDKENSNDSLLDVTDIRKHELVIEKQKQISSKHFDESINNIEKKMSILNKIRCSRSFNSSQENNSYKYQDHRLTKNFASPDLSKSPLCSTPFKEKYRSQSIYKFSPISIEKNEDSPNYVTIVEESHNDESLVLLEEQKDNVFPTEDITPVSPIIQLSVDKSHKSDKSSKTATKLDLESPPPITEASVTSAKSSKIEKIKTAELISLEISDFQTTEVEPFIGFSNPQESIDNSIVNADWQSLPHMESNESEENIDTSFTGKDESYEVPQSIIETSCQIRYDSDSEIFSCDSKETEDYDTCSSDQSLQNLALNDIRVPVVNVERLDNSLFMEYYVKQLSDYEEQERNSSNMDSDDFASLENSDSLVNSDDSISSQRKDDEDLFGERTANADLDHLEATVVSENINEGGAMDLENIELDRINTNCNEDSISSNYSDCTRNEEEERCFNFVTTRRRNEVTNNSIILSFSNSLDSISSADCDKTVLSNNEIIVKADVSFKNDAGEIPETTNEAIHIDIDDKGTLSSRRESCRLMDTDCDSLKQVTRDAIKQSESNVGCCSRITKLDSSGSEVKPIVLQPGKKWERSLSIYRRITMMTDQFDQSILEDEPFKNKGRNYRQSVISTMELQDFRGSLHNDSIISRRSTFVSKPSRSTIRIVKEPNSSRLSLCTNTVSEDLKGKLLVLE